MKKTRAKAKPKTKPKKGLGDVVKAVADTLPDPVLEVAKEIKKKITGREDCGCEDDQKALNEWSQKVVAKFNSLLDYRGRRAPAQRLFTEAEYKRLTPHIENGIPRKDIKELHWMADLRADVFGQRISGYPCTSCGGARAYIAWYGDLKKLYLSM